MMKGKTYSDDDRRYFAGFIADRDKLRPIECHGGLDCWVEFGPPAMMHKSKLVCVGCNGAPEIPWIQRGKPYSR